MQYKAYSVGLMHASVDDVFIRQINGKLDVFVVTCKYYVVESQ